MRKSKRLSLVKRYGNTGTQLKYNSNFLKSGGLIYNINLNNHELSAIWYKKRFMVLIPLTLVLFAYNSWSFYKLQNVEVLAIASETGSLPEEQMPEGQIPSDQEESELPAVEETLTIIAIDAGHGGDDPGCERNDVAEKDINLLISLELKDILESQGYEVIMTREGDSSIEKEKRIEIVNDSHADMLISIHQNAFDDGLANGIETWYCDTDNKISSKRLAKLIQYETVLETEARDRRFERDAELFLVREAAMPACLVETGFLSNSEEFALLQSPMYQRKIAQGIANGIHRFLIPPVMYLTFDDGPSSYTLSILKTLEERQIKATFFVVGSNVRKYPDIARKIVEDGHTIGIHCNSHVYKDIYASVESYVKDFYEAYDAVVEITGAKPEIFRFPGGSINDFNRGVYSDIIKEMTNRGFVYFDWNAGLDDAFKYSTSESILQRAKESVEEKETVILLAHDTNPHTAEILDEIINLFPEHQMERLSKEITPVQFGQK